MKNCYVIKYLSFTYSKIRATKLTREHQMVRKQEHYADSEQPRKCSIVTTDPFPCERVGSSGDDTILQPAKHGMSWLCPPTSPYPNFFLVWNLFSKWIAPTDNMWPKLYDKYTSSSSVVQGLTSRLDEHSSSVVKGLSIEVVMLYSRYLPCWGVH